MTSRPQGNRHTNLIRAFVAETCVLDSLLSPDLPRGCEGGSVKVREPNRDLVKNKVTSTLGRMLHAEFHQRAARAVQAVVHSGQAGEAGVGRDFHALSSRAKRRVTLTQK